jgi:hypothetical protein
MEKRKKYSTSLKIVKQFNWLCVHTYLDFRYLKGTFSK